MIQTGLSYILEVSARTAFGYFLEDDDGDQILLPNVLSKGPYKEGDRVEVFVYLDDKSRRVATTARPFIQLYEFAYLECAGISPFGAFMSWGLERDLLVPNSLQSRPIQEGEKHVVYLFRDDKERLTGSTKIADHLEHEFLEIQAGQEVDLLVYEESKLGMKVIVDNIYDGLVYHNEIFRPLAVGDTLKGYIGKIRDDGKMDIFLRRFGYKKVRDETDVILDELSRSGGFLPFHDKSDPDEIRQQLQMSKKVFKKAIGALYKQKLIRIEENGIYKIGR